MVVLRVKDNFGNQETLDILQEGGLFCDISAIESGDIGEVFGISSQEFILPGTKKNNKFFGNLYDLGTTGNIALNHTIYCNILVDGQEVFAGRMYLNDIVTDQQGYTSYKAVVINETVDFKTRVSTLGLNDLDFSQYDHLLTIPNVTSSWSNDLFSGSIVYPLIDFGNADPETTIAIGAPGDATFNNAEYPLGIEYLKPAIKVKNVIDAIFDEVNYSYSSSFIDSDHFNRIYMVSTADSERAVPGQSPTDNNLLASFSGSVSQSIADGASATVLFPTEKYDNGNNYTSVTGEYTVPAQGKYDVSSYLDIQWDSAPSSGEFNKVVLDILVNGTSIKKNHKYSTTTFARPGVSVTTGILNPGDTIEIQASTSRIQTGTGNVLAGATMKVLATNNGSQFSVKPSINKNVQVSISNLFGPDLNVLDFLRGLIQKFNLVIEPKRDEENTLIIEPFNDWRDAGEDKDWTDKVDRSVRFSIKGTMIDQAHLVNFNDEEDTDYLNNFNQENYGKVFGEALFEDGSDLSQGTKEIGSFFAPTPVMAIKGGDTTIIPHIYEAESTNDNKKPFQFKPRILYNVGQRLTSDLPAYSGSNYDFGGYYLRDLDGNIERKDVYCQFNYLDLDDPAVTSANTGSGIYIPSFEATRDLNFNNSHQYHYVPEWMQPQYYVKRDAVYEYWAEYINELYDPESKTLTCNIYFTPNEIHDIQLNDNIFIDGHTYRINKITNFPLTERGSVQVELIKTLARKSKYPRRRIYNIDGPNNGSTGSGYSGGGGGFTDLTNDGINVDGTVDYVFWDDGLPATGSGNQDLVGRVAKLDRYTYIPNDSGSAVWNMTPTQPTQPFRPQNSQGNNDIEYTANNVSVVGSGNVVNEGTSVINIQGSENNIQNSSTFVSVQGDRNTVEEFVEKSNVISSTNSKLTQYTQLGTIIGGEDTIISGSNKSVAIGQDLTVQGGNSNIVVGNYDSQTKTVKDLINTVVINPNRDLESRNSAGEDFNGRAYIGSYQDIGARYSDNTTLTLSAGQTLYLTGSTYTNDAVYNVSWSGSDGTAQVYLPEVDVNISTIGKGQGGYKRYLRFITDGTFDAGKNVGINVAAGDYLNGNFNGGYTLDAPYQNFEIYGVSQSYWRVLEAGVPDITNGGHSGAYGSFYSTADQSIVTSGSAQLVTLNNTQASNKIALSGSGAIQMDYNGAYHFTYTAQVQNADNVIHYADFWVKYNGVDYPNSSVRVAVPARKSASEFTTKPVTVNLLDVAVNDGDKIELYWRGDSTLLSLNYDTFGGTIPAAPSVRATIKAV